MHMQAQTDGQQLFVCEVNGAEADDDKIQEAMEASIKCHEPELEAHMTTSSTHDDKTTDDATSGNEFAWDDVNNCKVDPAKVREARRAEMDCFRKTGVQEGPEPALQGFNGEDAYQGTLDKHQQAG
jgi:hypothetical protein